MAGKIPLNEKIERFAVAEGPRFTRRLFSFNQTVEEQAARLAKEPDAEAFIIEQRVTWRGKNGKRTITEVSRVKIAPDGARTPVAPRPTYRES